jgi:SOS-response transcriptional repressor LexA
MGHEAAWEALLAQVEKLKAEGVTGEEIARRMGFKSRSYVTKILKGDLTGKQMNATRMMTALRGLDLDPSDYYTIGPSMEDFGFVRKVKASLGAGSSLETDGDELELYAFRKPFLANIGPQARLALHDVVGDSMEPTLRDGDTVLLNTQDTDVRSGEIYAVRIDDELLVKRVTREPGRLILASDNPRYPDITVDPAGANFGIVGRVRWMARRFR